MELARADYFKCDHIACLLAKCSIPSDHENACLDGFSSGKIANFYLLLVGICHQTQSLAGIVDGKGLRGWDYLSMKLGRQCRVQPDLLSPDRWSQISENEVKAIFRDEVHGTTLSDLSGRAGLIRDIGSRKVNKKWKSFHDIHAAANGFIESYNPNILQLLNEFQAYRDPVRKKSYFLLGLLANSGSLVFQDPQNLGAPVDYHEVRGHLRLKTVVLESAALRQKIMDGEYVSEEEDVAIRQAVANAIQRISEHPKLPNPMTLHYLFWYLFRHICRREAPFCHSVPTGQETGLPNRYKSFLSWNEPPSGPNLR